MRYAFFNEKYRKDGKDTILHIFGTCSRVPHHSTGAESTAGVGSHTLVSSAFPPLCTIHLVYVRVL